MIEKINNITLDLTYYGGQDLYSDGAIEDELLSLVETHSEEELNGLIRDQFSWPLLYHFSQIRQNIVTWLPIRKDQSVLEIGSGCGAITGGLARMADHVTCIELSKKRSLINANRNKAYDNIEIKVGNFTDVEPNLTEQYDYITLIGVFEYAECYIQSENPYHDFLERIKKHLKPGGKIVIAIENRLGMKYIAGCKEDHTARIGEGLDHYTMTSGVKTFDKKEISAIFDAAGFYDYQFFYPYPDYKLPLEIYSDAWLPKQGKLTQNINNLDQSRLYLFNESDAFDKAIELGIFDEVSNSFEIVLGNPDDLQLVYAKFSNDRGQKYAIQTQILQDANGKKYVKKLPENALAKAHVENIYNNEASLASDYVDTKFVPNKVVHLGDEALFEFVDGVTLEHELDACLSHGDMDGFYKLFDVFVEELKKATKEYVNIDFIPANILIKDDAWHVIDYEWVFSKDAMPVANADVRFVIYRAIHYYLGVSKWREDKIDRDALFAHFGFGKEELNVYAETEKAFQAVLDQDYYKLMTAKNEHHKMIADVNTVMAELDGKPWNLSAKIYYKEQADTEKSTVEEIDLVLEPCDRHMVLIQLPVKRSIQKIELCRPDGKYIYGMERTYCVTKANNSTKSEVDTCYLGAVLIGHEQVFLTEAECLTIDFSNISDAFDTVEIYLRETDMTPDALHVVELKNAEIAQQKEYIEGLKENIRLLEEAVQTMENSSSWKVTKPLRSVSRMMHGEKND